MRRSSGSSSCLLRPKNSLSEEDLNRLAKEAPTTTVLTVDRLRPYCTDRLYLLSELDVHANSIRFLCDFEKQSSSASSNNVNDGTPPPVPFPPSIILYLLWKPNIYPTPRSFADGPLSECVRQCLLVNGDEASTEELEVVRTSARSSPYSPRRQLTMDGKKSTEAREEFDALGVFNTKDGYDNNAVKDGVYGSPNSKEADDSGRDTKPQGQKKQKQQLTRIYVVVDRISPSKMNDALNKFPNFPDLTFSPSEEDNPITNQKENFAAANETIGEWKQERKQLQTKEEKQQQQSIQHNNEVKTAEQLARAVASSPFLRTRIDGISVGITSDDRAAPGLEACMDTVERGARERRLAARDSAVRSITKKQKENTHALKGDFYAGDENMQHFGRRELTLERIREKSPERSAIALVAMQPDDIDTGDGHDHSHHHSHAEHEDTNPKILQCRVSTEWNGKGEYKSFSGRAMIDWRQAWYGSSGGGGGDIRNDDNIEVRRSSGSNSRPKVPRITRGREELEEEEYNVEEPISTVMVVVFLAVMAAYVWNSYGDIILSFMFGEVLVDKS